MKHEEWGFRVGWLAGAVAMCALYEFDLAAWQKVALPVLVYFLARLVLRMILTEDE